MRTKAVLFIVVVVSWCIAEPTALDGNAKSVQFNSGAPTLKAEKQAIKSGQTSSFGEDDINLRTGQVALNIPFKSLLEMGHLKSVVNSELSLVYNNCSRQSRFANNHAIQTSVIGLGWSWNYFPVGIRSVNIEHEKTATQIDDSYFINAGEENSSLISWMESGQKKFRIKNEPNIVADAVYNGDVIVGFKFTLVDGTILSYGDYRGGMSDEDPNGSTWYTLRSGTWVGYGGSPSTAPATTWSRFPYKFELSRIQDAYGNSVFFNYSQSIGKTFSYANLPSYTKDVFLSKISFTVTSQFIQFEYLPRQEFELGNDEQMFETFSCNYLKSIDFMSAPGAKINGFIFDYSMVGYSDATKKRVLESIIEEVPQKQTPTQFDRRAIWAFKYNSSLRETYGTLKSYCKIGGLSKEFEYAADNTTNMHSSLNSKFTSSGYGSKYYVLNDGYFAVANCNQITIYDFKGNWQKSMQITAWGNTSDENTILNSTQGDIKSEIIGIFGTQKYLVAVLAQVSSDYKYRTRYIQSFHYDGFVWHKDNRADIWCNDDVSNPNNTNGYWRAHHGWFLADSISYAIGEDFYIVSTHTMRNVFASYWDENSQLWIHDQAAAVAPTIATHSNMSQIDNSEIYWNNLACGNDFFIAEYQNRWDTYIDRGGINCAVGNAIRDYAVVNTSESMLLAPHVESRL